MTQKKSLHLKEEVMQKKGMMRMEMRRERERRENEDGRWDTSSRGKDDMNVKEQAKYMTG